MRYTLTIPARINLLGNPADANEGDYATISAAVELRASATIEPAQHPTLEMEGEILTFSANEVPLPYNRHLDLLKGAVNRLYQFSPEFRRKLPEQGFHLRAWTDVPRQSGLGGSSLFVLLALASLRQFYDLDRRIHNDYLVAELTQRVEGRELGITCGFADRYVPLFGGIAYVDYRGKLHHHEVHQEPLATYEKLDLWVQEIPLVAITTGIQHDSGDVHGRMRPRFVMEHDAWLERGGEPPQLEALMRKAWETAWRGKIALLAGDLEIVGALMNENHRLVNAMMEACGFADGAGWANNLAIQTALENGALGAKLTGAGGGGSVFALVRPGGEPTLETAWQAMARRSGLESALVFRPRIARQGLVCHTEPLVSPEAPCKL